MSDDDKKDPRSCTVPFCGKSQHEVRKLDCRSVCLYVCNECVDLCNDIIREEEGLPDVSGGCRTQL